MAKNLIMRPIYNRPEMLKLSLEYEIKAREYFKFDTDLHTVFIVEHGSPAMVVNLAKEYAYSHEFIFRESKYGLTINILEGMKTCFGATTDFLIYIEDDVLVHKTYFQYMSLLLNHKDVGKFSVLSPYNQDDNGLVNEVYRGHHYAALAPLINKGFFETYVKQCINSVYYENYGTRDKFVRALDEIYKDNKLYKYRNAPGVHNEQAGLHNRLVDLSLIEEGKHVIMPKVNRQQHIGFAGKNRIFLKPIPGNTFDERVESLREIIKDPKKMYDMAGSKEYNDYMSFSPKLEKWDGTLYVK